MKTFLIFLLLIPQSLGIMKMIQGYGVVTYGPFPVAYSSSTNCSEGCFHLDYCILSWKTPNGSCYHYSYLDRPYTIKVGEIGKEENSIVAFKTIVTGTTCPSSYTDMDFKMTISSGDTYSWIKTGNSWNLIGCRDGWKRFDRTSGISVCMKTFYSPGGFYRWVARENCKTIGTDQIGVASAEESRWIHEQMMQYNTGKKAPFAFWTDGRFMLNCGASYCEKVTWDDGYTTGIAALNTSVNFDCKCASNMCLSIAYIPVNAMKTITSVDCNVLGDGYVCGYDLKKSV
ncbi:hypothetical protein B9Z55_015643 [Caenorhabditis nigoni]|uniref:PAN-3 domain-containing protein n=1 Tax=Caenorhabditis nigoni TaxID=1611254 RepID=A0A2G5UB45_9PELO|nr:hypothetical protein B9Z55_015643 [Caenorhabditis nigoni]